MIEGYGYIPLHQQYLSWGVRAAVRLEPRADDVLDLRAGHRADRKPKRLERQHRIALADDRNLICHLSAPF